jgi:hypothetical protein
MLTESQADTIKSKNHIMITLLQERNFCMFAYIVNK